MDNVKKALFKLYNWLEIGWVVIYNWPDFRNLEPQLSMYCLSAKAAQIFLENQK